MTREQLEHARGIIKWLKKKRQIDLIKVYEKNR